MLDISKLHSEVPQQLRALVNELRRIDTSPVVIQVHPHADHYVSFADSRFKDRDDRAPLRLVRVGYMAGEYTIRSERIRNKKHNPNSTGYRERTTHDARKAFKILLEVVHPFTPREIFNMTDGITDEHYSWVERPRADLRTQFGLMGSPNDFTMLEEIAHLQGLGFSSFKSSLFQKLAKYALPIYEEYQRRLSIKVQHMHVFIDHDGKVIVTTRDTNQLAQQQTYESLLTAPEHVQQQVAVLKLVDEGSYVPEVGRRMSSNVYWVHVPLSA